MTTTLNSTTVADPFDYTANLEHLGSYRRSANGTILMDYYSTTPKYRIKLQWRVLTSAERTALVSQMNACVSGARTLVLPDGRSFSVWLDVENDISEIVLRDATGYKYNVSASFIEA